MRILVGTVEIAGMLADYADGFRRLGYPVTSVIKHRNRFFPHLRYDADIGFDAPDVVRWPSWIAGSRSPAIRFPRGAVNRLTSWSRFLWLIAAHDVFVFNWGPISLTDENREFPLLKRLGKSIVSIFSGSDVRHGRAYIQQYAGPSAGPEFSRELLERAKAEPFAPLRTLRRGERWSNLIVSLPNQAPIAVRPYAHLFVPIDVSKYACHIPGRDRPVVVHAPSSTAIKGTRPILQALDALRADGVAFDLRLMQDATNEQVRAELTGADVVIDQLYLPLHGRLGVEAMASGCALASCNRQDYEPLPADRPVWHIDAENIQESLKRLLTDKPLRVGLAQAGRAYVERYHDSVIVAKGILDRLKAPANAPYDHYPTFFQRQYRLEPGEMIPEDIKRMTTQIIRRWGLPSGVEPGDLVARGLMSGEKVSGTPIGSRDGNDSFPFPCTMCVPRSRAMKNFAITGVAGFVAPRHLEAIRATGNRLVAAADPHDAVGILDRFAFEVRFFTEIERFDRHLEKLRRGPEDQRVHYLSICTPNYLHDAHIRMALRSGADAICEKPIVINPWNLDALQELERETGRSVSTILQLRLHPALLAVKDRIASGDPAHRYRVNLTYMTSRGRWYLVSWKGSQERSGGLATNIGIHFFDMLIWLFGPVTRSEVHVRDDWRTGGQLELERADVSWFMSADPADLPFAASPGKKTTFRSITVDGEEVEFSEGFTELHTRSYEAILAGRGFGMDDARASIELAHRVRAQAVTPGPMAVAPVKHSAGGAGRE